MEKEFWLDDVQEVLFTEEQIHERVKELAHQISQDYQERTPIVVGVLKGVMCFLPDLIRKMSIPVEVDFIAVSSYSTETRDKGVVRVVKDLDLPLMDRHVLFVEDVVDTGLTLHYLLRNLRARNPASLEVCTLLNKKPRRLVNIPIRYVGFEVPDYFVVGYGLDYNEQYRNLPYIAILKPSVLFGKN